MPPVFIGGQYLDKLYSDFHGLLHFLCSARLTISANVNTLLIYWNIIVTHQNIYQLVNTGWQLSPISQARQHYIGTWSQNWVSGWYHNWFTRRRTGPVAKVMHGFPGYMTRLPSTADLGHAHSLIENPTYLHGFLHALYG